MIQFFQNPSPHAPLSQVGFESIVWLGHLELGSLLSISVQRKHFQGGVCFVLPFPLSGDQPLNTFPRFGLRFLFFSRPLPPGLCTDLADLGLRFQRVVLNAVTIDDIWQGWKGGGSLEKLAPPK